MSDSWYILIPEDPNYVPDRSRREQALMLFSHYLDGAEEINAPVYDKIVFIDQGENFATVSCPACRSKLDEGWWGAQMSEACGLDPKIDWMDAGDYFENAQPTFESLDVVVPCCGSFVSLNDLKYNFPAGFARFALEAQYPPIPDLSDEHLAQLERVLGCKLRKIWARY